MLCRAIVIFALFSASGCSTLTKQSGAPSKNEESIRLNVPFVGQVEGQCGDASLMMVLRYHGIHPDPDTLKQLVYVPALKGTVPELIVEAAQSFGAQGRILTDQTIPRLQELLRQQKPPIVYVAPVEPHQVGHFFVVTGFNASQSVLSVHSGAKKNVTMPLAAFQEKWVPLKMVIEIWPLPIKPVESQ